MKTLFETTFPAIERNTNIMSKTSIFAFVFTAAMLWSILSMLAKLSSAVESAAAAFPSAL